MIPIRKLSVTFGLCAALLASTVARSQTSAIKPRIADYEQRLAQARAAHQDHDIAMDLIILGYLYRQAGLMPKAIDDLNEAVQLEQNANNKAGQALALSTLGRIYTDTGDEIKAIEDFRQSWAIWDGLGIKQGDAMVMSNIARAYNNLGQRDQALDYLNQAMQIWQDLGDQSGSKRMLSSRDRVRDLGQLHSLEEMNSQLPPGVREQLGRDGEADTLDLMGQTYNALGRNTEAIDAYNRALPIWRLTLQQGGEALTLTNMGRAYGDLGQKQNALDAFNRALAIWRLLGNRQGEALTLDASGRLYRDLGLQQTALDYFNRALELWTATGTQSGEGLALNDVGRAYSDLGQPQKGIDYSQQALTFWRSAANPRGEAMTLNNLGRDYFDLSQADKSLDYDQQALALWRQVKDPRGEAMAQMTIGWAQFTLNQWDKALVSELVGLALAKNAGDPDIEGSIETALMIGFRAEQHPQEAIFFGEQAVSSFQTIRKNISALDKDLQAGFAQSKSRTYRMLAELLIETGRLGEAERILDMLKEQELKDVVRDAAPNSSAQLAPLTPSAAQQKAQAQMDALTKPALALEQTGEEASALETRTALTPAEQAHLKDLGSTIEQEHAGMLAAFASSVFATLEQPPAPSGNAADAESYLQNSLAKLGPRVIGIRLLLGQDHVYEMLVTASSRKMVTLTTTPAALRSKTLETLNILAQRDADPRPQLGQLYAMMVAPIASDLKAIESQAAPGDPAPVLLWSLDDVLRYLPVAALYDGHQYLLERFNNILFTPESYAHMADAALTSNAAPSVLALGLTKSYGGLPALPGVMPELDSIVHDPSAPDSHGPMAGKLLPDGEFTLAALKTELGAGKGFPVVHIASHFVEEASAGQEPYLMLGGYDSASDKGYAWPLSDMENSPVAFHGTRLLTLSACSTGRDYTSRNGVEMDSLGMVAQQKDAEAVLATLWDVNDLSTSRLMSDFYTRWLKNPAAGKGEALRQAQIALLNGQPAAAGAASQRGFEVAEEGAPAPAQPTDYSLPYYWAPFVLIGNYK